MAFRDILYWDLVLRSVEKIQFWLKSGKMLDTLHEDTVHCQRHV